MIHVYLFFFIVFFSSEFNLSFGVYDSYWKELFRFSWGGLQMDFNVSVQLWRDLGFSCSKIVLCGFLAALMNWGFSF